MEEPHFDIQKLKRRDEAEWTRVHDECADALFSFLMRRTGNRREAAKDLTQQAFLTAFKNIHKYDDKRTSFLAWLFGVAKRDNRYFGHESREIAMPDVSLLREEGGDPQSGELSPREEVALLQEDEFLEAVLGTMPEQQEMALRLRYLEDLSHKEIGERLQLTEKGAEMTVRRARRRLQEAFFDAYPFLTTSPPLPQESIG